MRYTLLLLVFLVGCVPVQHDGKPRPKPPKPEPVEPDDPTPPTPSPAGSITEATRKLVLDWADRADAVGSSIGGEIKDWKQMKTEWNTGLDAPRKNFGQSFDSMLEPIVIPAKDPQTPAEQAQWEAGARAGWKDAAKQMRKAVGK